MSGRNAEIDSSWKLLASTTVKPVSLETSTREISGVPIFPATCTGNPAVSRMWPTSEVVVVLPFEPVMHTRRPRRNRHASSISLHTGIPSGARGGQRGISERHAGTRHDQILLEKGLRAVAAEFERDAGGAQLRRGFRNLRFGALFRGGDVRAARGAEQRRGDAGARQSDDQHLLAREFDSRLQRVYLNFNVVSENSAKTSATIQNRTIIFDSLHPASSK